MEPYKVKRNGRELMNAAAVGEMLGISGETYQWYVRMGKMGKLGDNPAPGHVEVDNARGERLYAAKEVRAWDKTRPGRGNWGGEGARARDKYRQGPGAAVDADGNPITADDQVDA